MNAHEHTDAPAIEHDEGPSPAPTIAPPLTPAEATPYHGDDVCEAVHPDPARPFLCTRQSGHTDRHVAQGADFDVMAAWSDADAHARAIANMPPGPAKATALDVILSLAGSRIVGR